MRLQPAGLYNLFFHPTIWQVGETSSCTQKTGQCKLNYHITNGNWAWRDPRARVNKNANACSLSVDWLRSPYQGLSSFHTKLPSRYGEVRVEKSPLLYLNHKEKEIIAKYMYTYTSITHNNCTSLDEGCGLERLSINPSCLIVYLPSVLGKWHVR